MSKTILTKEQENAGWSLLHDFVKKNDVYGIRNYPNIGEDINKKTKAGETVLHFAVKDNKPNIVKLLLDLGADHNIQDNSNCTPLLIAFVKPNNPLDKDLIFPFIDKRANTNLKIKGNTLWDIACQAKPLDLELLKRINIAKKLNLLSESPEEDVDHFDMGHIAAIENDVELIEQFFNGGSYDINEETKDGNTALHFAAMFNNELAFNKLKELGADLNKTNDKGQLPEQLFMIHSHKGTVSSLEEKIDQDANKTLIKTEALYTYTENEEENAGEALVIGANIEHETQQ